MAEGDVCWALSLDACNAYVLTMRMNICFCMSVFSQHFETVFTYRSLWFAAMCLVMQDTITSYQWTTLPKTASAPRL
jgi:hypothetical protein